jgi:hypothetical protein
MENRSTRNDSNNIDKKDIIQYLNKILDYAEDIYKFKSGIESEKSDFVLAFEEFICKEGCDNNYYVRHKEWGKRIWIGPYSSKKDAEKIIKAYVAESIKAPLDTKVNNKVHSIIIENAEKFFKL